MSEHSGGNEALLARFLQHAESGLRRMSFELANEQVTLFMRDGRLRELCTCGVERCEHIAVVLRFLTDGAAPADVRVRSSVRPPPPDQGAVALATAFEELCVACARAGIEARDSPSINQALAQLLTAAPDPVPLSLARWIGRFRDALAFGELGELSRLLDGALRFTDQLREGPLSAPEQRRAWLDEVDGSEALSEVTLVEVAREWITGLDRASIERRYLIELVSGQVYSEERRRDDSRISVGPCPRLAQVAFAEIDSATRPPRAKLLQYTLSVQVPEAPWQRVVSLAETQLSVLRERFAADLRASPALAEPFAIFAPAQLEVAANALTDAEGERLALRSDPNLSGIDALLAATRGADVVCVLGRMLGRASGLLMKPLSVVVRNGGWLELRRVT
ncbi:MAG TPA: hypothetical protein VFX59_02475 [Polyangiales bacterium]|nr:hypothetical protein [Polyangiales bacterium]